MDKDWSDTMSYYHVDCNGKKDGKACEGHIDLHSDTPMKEFLSFINTHDKHGTEIKEEGYSTFVGKFDIYFG